MEQPIVVSALGMEIIEWLDHPTSDEWLSVERFNKTAVTTLEKKGLLVSDVIDKKRVAKLTTLGRESRFDAIVHFTPEYYRYLASRDKQNGTEPTDEEIANFIDRAVNTPPISSNGDCVSECDSCIHREVLDLIASKYPKVAALRDAMLEQHKLMKELGL